MSAVPIPDPDRESSRERILLTATCRARATRRPAACSTPGAGRRRSVCAIEVPQLVRLAPGHQVACHFPEERDLVGVVDVDIDALARRGRGRGRRGPARRCTQRPA